MPRSIDDLLKDAEKNLPDTLVTTKEFVRLVMDEITAPTYILDFVRPLIETACYEIVSSRKRRRNRSIRSSTAPIVTPGSGRRGRRRSAAGARTVQDRWLSWELIPGKLFGDALRPEIRAWRESQIKRSTTDIINIRFAAAVEERLDDDMTAVRAKFQGLALTRLRTQVEGNPLPNSVFVA